MLKANSILNLCFIGRELYEIYRVQMDILDKRPRDSRQLQIHNASYSWVKFRNHRDRCEKCMKVWNENPPQ